MAVLFADGECHEDAYLEDPRDRWDDDEVTAVESYAAEGCEGDDMQDPDKSHWNGLLGQSKDGGADIDTWIANASITQLKSAYFGIEREVARRKAEVAAEAKALETFEKPARATRSDKGTTRERKEVAA